MAHPLGLIWVRLEPVYPYTEVLGGVEGGFVYVFILFQRQWGHFQIKLSSWKSCVRFGVAVNAYSCPAYD